MKTLISALCSIFVMMAVTAFAQDNSPGPDCGRCPAEAMAMAEMLFAQGPMGDDGPPRPDMDNPEARQQRRRHLEQLRMLKMLELLELREDQETEFLAAFNNVRQKHRGLDEAMKDRLDRLSDGLHGGKMADSEIYKLVDEVLKLENDKQAVMVDFLNEAKGMLSAEQYGKLVIFHKRFEAQLLERLGRFREGRRRGMGHGERQGEG